MRSRLNKPKNLLEQELDLAVADLMDIHKQVFNKWCEVCGIKRKCEACVITTTCECCLTTWPCATEVIMQGVWTTFKFLTTDDYS